MTELRSAAWFAAEGKTGIMHRSWLRSEGLPDDSFEGRPIIGIANSWSELTPCNMHLRELAEHVKRGVWQAGGVPFEFPTTSAGEPLIRPSAMLLRNLISMDLEETLRANPLDAVVLLAGCDKTTPAYLMGAASVDLPTILLTGGPMLNGKYRGTDIGSGTSVWRLTEQFRAGEITQAELAEAEGCMARSNGHCMTMGTASTMAVLTEVLGMQLPGGAALPANDSRRRTLAHLVGRRIVEMVAREPADVDDRHPHVVRERDPRRTPRSVVRRTPSSTCSRSPAGSACRSRWTTSTSWPRTSPRSSTSCRRDASSMEDFAYAGGVGALLSPARSTDWTASARTVTGATPRRELRRCRVLRRRGDPADRPTRSSRPARTSPCCTATSRRTAR